MCRLPITGNNKNPLDTFWHSSLKVPEMELKLIRNSNSLSRQWSRIVIDSFSAEYTIFPM